MRLFCFSSRATEDLIGKSFWSLLVILAAIAGMSCSNAPADAGNRPVIAAPTSVSRPAEAVYGINWRAHGDSFEALLEIGEFPNQSVPGTSARTRLVIRESGGTGVEYIELFDETGLSISMADFRIGDDPVVIVTAAAGSGEVLRVYAIGENGVRPALSAGYRDTYFAIVSPTDGTPSFFLADTDLDSNELRLNRYSLDGNGFVLTGSVMYKEFDASMKKMFGSPREKER